MLIAPPTPKHLCFFGMTQPNPYTVKATIRKPGTPLKDCPLLSVEDIRDLDEFYSQFVVQDRDN